MHLIITPKRSNHQISCCRTTPIDTVHAIPKISCVLQKYYLTSGAAAAAISWLIGVVPVSCGRPSKSLLHHEGGSKGLWPLCREG